MTVPKPVVLGIDEDRQAQVALARIFNDRGIFYRFITDRRKLIGGINQLKPDVLLVFGELSFDFTIQIFDSLAADVANSALPVVVACEHRDDAAFVESMRSGVVDLVPATLDAAAVDQIRVLWTGLSSRTGIASGVSDGSQLNRIVDLVRRTRRSGLLQTNPRAPSEGRAAFAKGRLESASFGGMVSQNALKALLAQGPVKWTFTEMDASGSEGSGVVIEVGEVNTGETEVIVGEDVEARGPDDYEMPNQAPAAAAAYIPPSIAPVEATPDAGAVRLLMVDDDDALLRMFSTLFRKHGFDVTTATDGRAGADLTLQREFDVVLADLNMPHLDGWGMLRVLRDDFRTRELPVAFVSAHDDYRESLKALNAGAQAYLSKGTRLEALVTQVRKLLEPRAAVALQLNRHEPLQLSFSKLGPQWFLKQVSARKLSGSIEARDSWAAYTLVVQNGVVVHTLAVAGKYTAEGERAFNAFVASRASEGTWTPGKIAVPGKSLFHPTEILLERASSALNESETRIRENLMVSATQIDVNEQLYAVYREVGPKQWLEAARLICEEKLPPREVIAKVDLSPLDVEETMKDLIRRGVVTLRKG